MSEDEKLIKMAEESFSDLQVLENASDRLFWNSLYYSVFYAAKAALLSLGFEPKTHSGTDRLVGKILHKDEELISSEEAKFYSRMKTAREEKDYNPGAEIDYDKREMKNKAENFIQQMKQIMEEEN